MLNEIISRTGMGALAVETSVAVGGPQKQLQELSVGLTFTGQGLFL
jgi:hypothetical protein